MLAVVESFSYLLAVRKGTDVLIPKYLKLLLSFLSDSVLSRDDWEERIELHNG